MNIADKELLIFTENLFAGVTTVLYLWMHIPSEISNPGLFGAFSSKSI